MSEGEPAADSLAAEAVAPLLRGSFGSPYIFEEQRIEAAAAVAPAGRGR